MFGSRGRVAAGFVFVLALGLTSSTASAFKPRTHVGAANRTVSEFESRIDDDPENPNTLVFEVNGQRLQIQVNNKEAFQAVKDWPEFYRAGTIGPDAYPDPMTGQALLHGDHSLFVGKLGEKSHGHEYKPISPAVKLENRKGPSTYRAIDFAIVLLEFWREYDWREDQEDERAQALAFVMGYFSHGVGDSFAHTWVNELSGGAFVLGEGQGLFGTFTEEVKHNAIEMMVDEHLPDELISIAPNDHALLELRTPEAFLDAFFATRAPNAYETGNKNGNVGDWLEYYANPDQFYGGPFYSYLNAQVALAPALKNWTPFNGFFDFAEAVRDNPFVNFHLDMAEVPAEFHEQMTQGIGVVAPGYSDSLSFLSGGLINCSTDGVFEQGNIVEEAREVLDLIGGVNDRIDDHKEKARIMRRNWIRLSECTSQNITKLKDPRFDDDFASQNTDACADIVRAGWQDEGNPTGLYRGSIRGTKGGKIQVENVEFLVELKAAFLGGDTDDLFGSESTWTQTRPDRATFDFDDDETLEHANGHRALSPNLTRLMDYITGPAGTFEDLAEIVAPESVDGVPLRQRYDAVCEIARRQSFEDCLDVHLAPAMAVARAAECHAQHAECIKEPLLGCIQEQCSKSPTGNFLDLCDEPDENACLSAARIIHACIWIPEVCFPWGCEGAFYACADQGGYETSKSVCNIYSSAKDGCFDLVTEEGTKCGPEHVYCDAVALADRIADPVKGEHWAEKLLGPVRQACDTVDDAIAFVECVKGDSTQTDEVNEANRRTCVTNACADNSDELTLAECQTMYDEAVKTKRQMESIQYSLNRVSDVLMTRPGHEFVNLAFLREDAKKDPDYAGRLRTLSESKRSTLVKPPASASTAEKKAYERKIRALDEFDRVLAELDDPLSTVDPLADIDNRADDAADVLEDMRDLGLLPTEMGPTARSILGTIGPVFEKTFLPFFNTLQGMKLVPLDSGTPEEAESDLAKLYSAHFEDEDAAMSLLPGIASSGGADDYSFICTTNPNWYCDALKSFDDPNCVGSKGQGCEFPEADFAQHGWVPGRGLVAWNEYKPNDPQRNVLTSFPLSSSQEAYDRLYRRVFKVPGALPLFMGFEEAFPDRKWTSSSATLKRVSGEEGPMPSEGASALQVKGCNYMEIVSPVFDTTELGVIGDRLLVDVFIPANPTNRWWIGDMNAYIDVPGAAGAAGRHLGYQAFTSLRYGEWNTLSFALPSETKTALNGDHANATIKLAINWGTCPDMVYVDNLRFDGYVKEREIFHVRGSESYSVVVPDVFSFDRLQDWSATDQFADIALRSETGYVLEGDAALAIDANGWTSVSSRPFSTSELSLVTNTLSLDVFIQEPQPQRWWVGDVQMHVRCDAGLNNHREAYIGYQPLTHRFEGEYNSLTFTIPDEMVAVLSGAQGTFWCQVSVAANIANRGEVFLDNLGFVQPD